jgi:hypothetical protein
VTQFEYVAVLVSIVTGLGIVHLLSGVTRFISTRGQWSPYWVHLLWTWNVFHYLVFFWWFVWRWTAVPEWSLSLYFFILLYAVVLYLLCAVLFPPGERETDFRTIYFQNRAWFFGLWTFLMLIDIVDTTLKQHYGLSGFGASDIIVWAISIAGSLVAARSRSHRVHAVWGVAFFLMMSVFEYMNFGVLRAD